MMYRLRVYTVKDSASLAVHRDVHYPRHFGSFAEFGISIQGIWTSPGDDAPRLYVLTIFPADADPVQIERDFMQSPGFKADMEGFDRSNIVRVETTLLAPPTHPRCASRHRSLRVLLAAVTEAGAARVSLPRRFRSLGLGGPAIRIGLPPDTLR